MKKYATYIQTFQVHHPQHSGETKGELLHRSMFGQFCPPNSLRGYSLQELLTKPQHYRPHTILDEGQTITL